MEISLQREVEEGSQQSAFLAQKYFQGQIPGLQTFSYSMKGPLWELNKSKPTQSPAGTAQQSTMWQAPRKEMHEHAICRAFWVRSTLRDPLIASERVVGRVMPLVVTFVVTVKDASQGIVTENVTSDDWIA
eukprot:1142202-Pelagomonas_calceolata.AAC.1